MSHKRSSDAQSLTMYTQTHTSYFQTHKHSHKIFKQEVASNSDDAKSLATASSLSISPLHQKNDDLSDQGHLNTPASVPHDMHVGDRGSTNTQTLLDHTHLEPSSYPLFDLPETLSFAPHQSFGHIEHLSTSADESQPKTPVNDHFKSMPVMHQPQVLPDTEHPRTQLQKSLQAVGIPHPSFTKIGRFAHQPPDLLNGLHTGLFRVVFESLHMHGMCPPCDTSGIG